MKSRVSKFTMITLLGLGIAGAATQGNVSFTDSEISKKLLHEIRMYSQYSIWDNINFRIHDGNVELLGEVNQPYKTADLTRIARHVPGVASVTNELKVLPVSFYDDRLRVQVARAIFRDPVLSLYALQTVPTIHIIVDNGHITLEGVVNNEMEKNVAGIRANSAGLSFGQVTNNLRVENPSRKG